MRLFTSSIHALALAAVACAHTTIWSVWVNGVDQSSGVGIRLPAYNDPPLPANPAKGQSAGYNNSPVQDLTSIDLRCNVLGDVQNPHTVPVHPGDIVTLEWHHNWRNTSDDIIATSHLGPSSIYLSPDPPTNNSWVKIQEEGLSADGTWYTGQKLNMRQGKQDLQIPSGIAPGFYLLRSDLIALHQAEISRLTNKNFGAQVYVGCVQLEVLGSGTTTLPVGVGFPGAYGYNDPGILYNIYNTPLPPYTVPGPTVWSGAAPSPTPPVYGSPSGYTTAPNWSTWIGSGFQTATLQTSVTVVTGTETVTQTYVPAWSSAYKTPAPTAFDATRTSFEREFTTVSPSAAMAVPTNGV
ncbi:hypothetical protein PUNSTDRAFT_142953 [Punctularia strigosozonata HHB-11173 SS5]|uniref:uncharacterized protein n=1 Tax=Punctularia strigosozonata (strain HHB-11173) TaxID=741275 RepID=UPI0004416F71|nr:uncharacterized protein PUNSTDRAFT_142953 [Punctularia strigosozonata HHB-11173 SS5]EIN11131.1 hypothetical protein PUNSTDRAFT_142953 [Punctularia strigosozonata HHB-11173 SS5]